MRWPILVAAAAVVYVLMQQDVPPQLQDVTQEKAIDVLNAVKQVVQDNIR